jgi:hypothetical protein
MTTPPLDPHQHFYEVEELAQLSLAELQALWDNVQTEDQAYLVRVFEREASKRQIVEDLDESQMAHYFLQQYQTLGFVPAGDVWLKIPPDIREQYKHGVVDAPDENATASTTTSFPRWLMLLAIPFVCLMVFALMRMLGGGSDSEGVTLLATNTPTSTATLSPTPTPTLLPSLTPFALSGFDDAIAAGERANRRYYPVQLQIFPSPDAQPRVFIVQQTSIRVAEWQYDPNPDVVSWLGGLLIRPVLGVPFSTANLELFRSLNEQSVFVVTMNTGDILQFTFAQQQQVLRTSTHIFQQTAPGLVLALIGETARDGTPTDVRYVVLADYPAEQELGALPAVTPATPTPTATPAPPTSADVQVQLGRISVDDATLRVRLTISNPTAHDIDLQPSDFTLILGYIPQPQGISVQADIAPFTLPANTRQGITLMFPYNGEGYATLTILGRIWGLDVGG